MSEIYELTEIKTDNLHITRYYTQLFPLERVYEEKKAESIPSKFYRGLRNNILEKGFNRNYPIVVRQRQNKKGVFEIIDGVGRFEICRELGIDKILSRVVKLSDDEARIEMIESAMASKVVGANISTVQA